MFKIYGGKTEFTQWGMDQRVTNPNMKDGDEVAFQARGKTYLRRAYARSGEIVADVPNFILQEAGEITVKLGLGLEEHLASRTTFNVAKQDKPEGYDCKYNINNREPNRQLVTDAYGKEVWEERLAWSDGKREVEIFPETTLPYSETHEGFVNIGMGIGLEEGISVGDVAVVSYNGVEYTCVAEAFAA